ncbi:MAG: M3 family metallopeptidase [Bacteroidales bacterium]|nr:M3 family metallopeptidase [Bacteroidales bacterium]
MENPLFVKSENPFGAPAFDKISTEHYKPAFEKGVAEGMAEIDAIVANSDAPDFENTIVALERAGKLLDNASSIFFNLNEACTNDQMQALAEELAPLITQYSMYVILNEPLFEKVKMVYEKRETLNLTPEQARLLSETYKLFAENGAALAPERREEFAKVREELAILSLRFSKNVLAATNAFTLNLTDEADLAGLPGFVRDMAASEAKERGVHGWVFTLDFPSFSPFMKYSDRRDLRERIWRAYSSRCVGGEFDNSQTIKDIVSLRIKLARLMDCEVFAQYSLKRVMAKTPETVTGFLADLMAKSLPFARRDIGEIKAFAAENGFTGEFQPWDFSYWSEKYQKAKYDLDSELLKPYFELSAVRKAVFDLAGRLYGLSFEERMDIPPYHPDVIVYEVKDGERFMGLLYMDFFPRASKRGGAWMTSFREAYSENGAQVRPFVSIVTNFTKPTESDPSLLTFGEITTLLHEFGHGLHGLLAEGSYKSLTGTNVARDFVELPSQIMENWAYEPEFLQSFARHYKTGEVIPREYIDRIIAAKNFLAGYSSVRQLQFGIIDMAWHTLETVPDVSVEDFEESVLADTLVLPHISGTTSSSSFNHIFSGGYSAGYYSYKWAEVLEADAFSLFKEKGIFSREVADSFRKNILSKGNLEDADVLFRKFRGRDPRPEALLEKSGMISTERK